jgi:hypothetical protein
VRRARRHLRVPPDLTSLFDVLFIVIFACLIRAAAAQQAAEAAARPAPVQARPVAVAIDPASLHARALTQIAADVAAKAPVIVRVSARGTVTAIEHAGQTTALDVPLLEHDPNPDVAIAYLGDRSAALRVCGIAAMQLGADDLADDLVIISPDAALDDLPHALYEGLHRDVDRCLADHHGLAVIVVPAKENR